MATILAIFGLLNHEKNHENLFKMYIQCGHFYQKYSVQSGSFHCQIARKSSRGKFYREIFGVTRFSYRENFRPRENQDHENFIPREFLPRENHTARISTARKKTARKSGARKKTARFSTARKSGARKSGCIFFSKTFTFWPILSKKW